MSDLLATIFARVADGTRPSIKEDLRTSIELTKLRLIERFRSFKPIWMALLGAIRFSRRFGARRLSARLVEFGQRSCPDPHLRRRFGTHGIALIDQLSVSPQIPDTTPEIFGPTRVSVLKPYVSPRERGVIHLKFSEVIAALPTLVDLPTLTKYYTMVLEPSWTGLCDPGPLQYSREKKRVIIMAPDAVDHAFISQIGTPLVPINLGPCDWVDPRVAEPFLGSQKEFDIVVNSNWAPWKRHFVLFDALRRMPRNVRVALIGGTWDGGDLNRIFRLARYYGVHNQITAFQFIPFSEVMRIVSASRCSVLLSLKEGANRSLAESMFCNVPVLLLAEHVGGITKNVVDQTGLIVPEREIVRGLQNLLAVADQLPVRKWALDNISCLRSSATLNQKLKDVSVLEGEEWTLDIAARANSPESTYYFPEDLQRLAPHNKAVHAFLRKNAPLPILQAT
jgi:glycosyltransferase involved in cell wall biosynthesis